MNCPHRLVCNYLFTNFLNLHLFY